MKEIIINPGRVSNVDVRNVNAHNNRDLETGLKNPRDPELKELRFEVLTIIESLKREMELKISNK